MSFTCNVRKRAALDDETTPEGVKREYPGHPDTPLNPYMMSPHQMCMYNPMMFEQSTSNYMDSMGPIPFWMQSQLGAPLFPTPTVTPPNHHSISTPNSNDSGISSDESPDVSSGDEVFGQVQGRLNLVGNLRQYKVTKAEVLRRIKAPECLNSSSLGALLRKAKTKDGGAGLRQQLERSGIHLPTNRRKGAANTAFTSLVEEEALTLGCDLDRMVGQDYPLLALVQHLNSLPMTAEQREEKRRDLLGMCRVMGELTALLHEVQVPLATSVPTTTTNDADLQKGMEHFSLITHGFGIVNQRTWAKTFERYAERALLSLDQPLAANQMMPMPWQLQM